MTKFTEHVYELWPLICSVPKAQCKDDLVFCGTVQKLINVFTNTLCNNDSNFNQKIPPGIADIYF